MSEEIKNENVSPDGTGKNAYYMQRKPKNHHHHKSGGEGKNGEEKPINEGANAQNRPAPVENKSGDNGQQQQNRSKNHHHHRHGGNGGNGGNNENSTPQQNQNRQNPPKKETTPTDNQKKNPHNDRGQNRRPERRNAPIEQDIYGDPKHDKEMADLRARIVLNSSTDTEKTNVGKDSPEKINEERTMDVSHILNETKKTDERKTVEVIGVQFRSVGKIYYFAPNGHHPKIGDNVVVETARGPEYGTVAQANTQLPEGKNMPPLKNVLRMATEEDNRHQTELLLKEKEALRLFRERIDAHDLPMSPFDVRYAFDGSQVIFYFSAENRVDFRDLVRDLAGIFHTRIELRQIGAKDEAKMLGGIGACGRLLCCTSFLGSFVTTGIRMAKDQGLAYSSKLNGFCGRPMCCLAFENQMYVEASKDCPTVGDIVQTPDGQGKVVTVLPLTKIVTVALQKEETIIRQNFKVSDLVVTAKEKREETPESEQNEKQNEKNT